MVVVLALGPFPKSILGCFATTCHLYKFKTINTAYVAPIFVTGLIQTADKRLITSGLRVLPAQPVAQPGMFGCFGCVKRLVWGGGYENAPVDIVVQPAVEIDSSSIGQLFTSYDTSLNMLLTYFNKSGTKRQIDQHLSFRICYCMVSYTSICSFSSSRTSL